MAAELTPDRVMEAVERYMSMRWVWGASDCCTTTRDVFRDLHGVDFMWHLPEYEGAIGAARLVKQWGGFPLIVERSMDLSDLRDGDGVAGDVGISLPGMTDGIDGRALLICIEPGKWAGKTEFGYAILPEAERCWSV